MLNIDIEPTRHSQIFLVSTVGHVEPPIDRFDHLLVQLEGGEQFLGDVGHRVPQSGTDGLHGGLQYRYLLQLISYLELYRTAQVGDSG